MTRAEFDTWIEQHLQDLKNVAVAVVGPRDADEAVAGAIDRVLRTRLYEKCRADKNPIAFFTNAVRSVASNLWRSRRRAAAARADLEYLSSGDISGARTPIRGSE